MADPLSSNNDPAGALENDNDDYSSIGVGRQQRDPGEGLEPGAQTGAFYDDNVVGDQNAEQDDYFDREEDVEDTSSAIPQEEQGASSPPHRSPFEDYESDEDKRRSEIEDDLSQYFDDVDEWDVRQIVDYVRDHMFENEVEEAEDDEDILDFCCDVLVEHDVTGQTVFTLTEADLVEMGITNEGDRNRLLDCFDNLERHSTPTGNAPSTPMEDFTSKRDYVVLWRGTEELYYNAFDHCLRSFCLCFPEDPALYELSNTHLDITMETPFRAGPIDLTCCFPPEFERDNIELGRITGAEVEIAIARCCGDHQEHVVVSLGEDEAKKLRLCQGEGRELVRILYEQLGHLDIAINEDGEEIAHDNDQENYDHDDQRETSDGDFDDYPEGESVERMERD